MPPGCCLNLRSPVTSLIISASRTLPPEKNEHRPFRLDSPTHVSPYLCQPAHVESWHRCCNGCRWSRSRPAEHDFNDLHPAIQKTPGVDTQSVESWIVRKIKNRSRVILKNNIAAFFLWAVRDSNPHWTGYEPVALTVKLTALIMMKKCCWWLNRQLIAKAEILAMKFSKNCGTSSYLKVDAVGSAGYEKASLAKILE